MLPGVDLAVPTFTNKNVKVAQSAIQLSWATVTSDVHQRRL